MLKLNDVIVTSNSDPSEWEPHQLAHEVHQKLLDNEAITDIEISELNHETKVTNELLDILASLNMPPTGLKNLTFHSWKRMSSPLDLAVI